MGEATAEMLMTLRPFLFSCKFDGVLCVARSSLMYLLASEAVCRDLLICGPPKKMALTQLQGWG